MQLYRYIVSQSSEFFRHKPLCYFSTSVYCYYRLYLYDSVRKLLDTPSYARFEVFTALKRRDFLGCDAVYSCCRLGFELDLNLSVIVSAIVQFVKFSDESKQYATRNICDRQMGCINITIDLAQYLLQEEFMLYFPFQI
jgi:hypothetical protein